MNAVHDCTDREEGSRVFHESFEYGEFDLGECLVPLKPTNELPRSNSLRNVTENTNGPLPPSPAIVKKKNMARLSSSPNVSPGSLVTGTITTASATLNGRRAVRSSIQNPLGGSLHGRGSSPGAMGGVRLGRRPRTRSNSPSAPLLRSLSPRPLGGSVHSRTASPTALVRGGLPMRRRSNSPGSLKSASVHGTSSLRPRSRSPGALQGRNRSFRVSRRMSLKSNRGTNVLVSILRKGKFSGVSTTTTSTTPATPATSANSSFSSLPVPPGPPGSSPPGSPLWSSSTSQHRKRLLGARRVTFWLPDEQSLTCSFATEESMAFAELGFDDSGEGFGCEDDCGIRTIRGGELAFIEVMGDDTRHVQGDDDDDYLVKRFNGSTIHEELGASFGEGTFGTSFSYLPSDAEDEEDDDNQCPPAFPPKEHVKQQDGSQLSNRRSSCFNSSQDDSSLHSSQGSFALPGFGRDNVFSKSKSKNNDRDNSKSKRRSVVDDNVNYHESFCANHGSFALPDFEEEDDYVTRKVNKSTRQNKNKPVHDSDDDDDDDDDDDNQGSFALPDLHEDEDIPMTKSMSNESKESKGKDKDAKLSAALPDLADHDVSRKKSKEHKSKDKNKEKKNDKDKGMSDDHRESLGSSQGSLDLPGLEEDIISHQKKAKKKKTKDVQDVEDNDVAGNDSFCVSQGCFTLADIGEDQVMLKTNKKTKAGTSTTSNHKEEMDSDDDRRDSFGENQDSLASLVFAEDETMHITNKTVNRNKKADDDDDDDYDDHQESFCASQGSFALPDSMDSSSLSSSPYHQYSNRSRARQQHPLFCQLPRSRRRNPTPPPSLRHSSRGGGAAAGSAPTSSSSSFSSSLRLEEALMTPVRQKTPPQPPSLATPTSWCCSESSLELSALRDSSKTSNRDSLSETSSESPTSVTELGGLSSQIGVGGEENGLNSIPVAEEDAEHRRLTVKRSMVSTLVPPIG